MTSPTSRVVAGREITFPVPVVSASVSGAAFLARADVVRRLIASGPQAAVLDSAGAEPVALPRGRTPVTAIHVRYHDVPGNVLGAYHEMGLAFQLKVPGVGTLVHVHELPVDQDFTLAAGNELWGFPKWKSDMVGTPGGSFNDGRLGPVGSAGAGGLDMTLDTRVGIPIPGSQAVSGSCIQVIDGQPVLVTADAKATGGRVRPFGGARLSIAPGADAADPTNAADPDVARFTGAIRELGLDRARPLATFSYEKFTAEFRAAEPLR